MAPGRPFPGEAAVLSPPVTSIGQGPWSPGLAGSHPGFPKAPEEPACGGPVHVLGGADVEPCARSSQLRPGSRQALGGGAGPAAHVRARFPRPRPPQQKSPEAGSGFRT